jgi:hypothetical protein
MTVETNFFYARIQILVIWTCTWLQGHATWHMTHPVTENGSCWNIPCTYSCTFFVPTFYICCFLFDVMLVFLICKNEMLEIHGDIFTFQFDMDMSYTRVLHMKVAYRIPHKWRHAFYVTRPLLCACITCYVTIITVEINHCSFRRVRFALYTKIV